MENVRWFSVATGAALAWLIGGFDELFKILILFAIIDYASGLTAAWIRREVNSRRGLRGLAKKIFIISLVVVAAKVDYLLHANNFLRNASIYGLLMNEGISIVENCGRMGIPIPRPFFYVFEKLQNNSEGGRNVSERN